LFFAIDGPSISVLIHGITHTDLGHSVF